MKREQEGLGINYSIKKKYDMPPSEFPLLSLFLYVGRSLGLGFNLRK